MAPFVRLAYTPGGWNVPAGYRGERLQELGRTEREGEMESQIGVDALAKALFQFAAMWPFIGALMALMLADIVMGTVAAYGMKKLNSTASFQGICKKTVTLILVGVCAIVGRLANMPLAEMAAGGYCITELLSIAEKAAMCGVKFPAYITEVLEKVRPNRVPESAPAHGSNGGA